MYNESKTTQAAAYLLKLAERPANLMVLLKMLYLADRAALMKHGRTITNDTYYAMKLGPVLGNTHDVSTEEQPPYEEHYWPRFISAREKNEVRLLCDPGNEDLSEAELKILDGIFKKFGHYLDDPFGLPKWMHQHLSEVKEVPSGQRLDLPIEEVLRGTGKSEEEISTLKDEMDILDYVDTFLVAR